MIILQLILSKKACVSSGRNPAASLCTTNSESSSRTWEVDSKAPSCDDEEVNSWNFRMSTEAYVTMRRRSLSADSTPDLFYYCFFFTSNVCLAMHVYFCWRILFIYPCPMLRQYFCLPLVSMYLLKIVSQSMEWNRNEFIKQSSRWLVLSLPFYNLSYSSLSPRKKIYCSKSQ